MAAAEVTTRRPPSFFSALKETVRAVFVEDAPDVKEIFRLVRGHQIPQVLDLLRAHPSSWHVVDDGGHSLLHWAALGGSMGLATGALEARVSVDALGGTAHGEQTPLMWAVSGGSIPMVRLLLNAEANPLAQDTRGGNCLIRAVQQSKLESIDLLVQRGGRMLLKAGDVNGCAASHWAAYVGNLEALTTLEALGDDLLVADNSGMTPLHHAVWAYRPAVVRYLLTLGADPTQLSRDGKSCVDIAEEKGNPGMRALILSEMLTCLLTHRARRSSAEVKGNGKDAAEAMLFRTTAADTPLAHGVAVSWTSAWLGAVRDGRQPPLQRDTSTASKGATTTSFELDYVNSLEKLRTLLARRVEELADQLTEEMLVCYLIVDRHGCIVDLLSSSQEELPPDRFPLRAQLAAARETSGNELAKLAPLVGTGLLPRMCSTPDLYCQRVLTRVPASLRWSIWKELLRVRERGLPSGDLYHDMASQESEFSTLIQNDIGRTFMSFDHQQQGSLQRMLNAYAAHNPDVGYCQGMNMIAGLLLLISNDEEESFAVLVCLMDDLGLAEFYKEGFPRLQSYLGAVDELMAEAAPELVQHFTKEGVELRMYLQQWFLTLFIDCLPLPLVVNIWDAIVCEGLLVAFKVAVSILTSLQEPLRQMRFQDIATAFKTMRRHADCLGEWKAFEAGHLLVRQAALVQVPERLLDEHGLPRKNSRGFAPSPSPLSSPSHTLSH